MKGNREGPERQRRFENGCVGGGQTSRSLVQGQATTSTQILTSIVQIYSLYPYVMLLFSAYASMILEICSLHPSVTMVFFMSTCSFYVMAYHLSGTEQLTNSFYWQSVMAGHVLSLTSLSSFNLSSLDFCFIVYPPTLCLFVSLSLLLSNQYKMGSTWQGVSWTNGQQLWEASIILLKHSRRSNNNSSSNGRIDYIILTYFEGVITVRLIDCFIDLDSIK